MRQVINSVYAITLLFSLFALMPAVYGLTIHVNAIPNTDVYVAVLEADKSYTPIETFTKNSGETGKLDLTLSTDASMVDIMVLVKKEKIKIMTNRFEDYQISGGEIYLDIYDSRALSIGSTPFEEKKEEQTQTGQTQELTQNNSENLQTQENLTKDLNVDIQKTEENIQTNEGSKITALAALGNNVTEIFNQNRYYFIFGIIGVAAIIFVILGVRMAKHSSKEHYYDDRPPIVLEDPTLAQVERELRRARQELRVAQESISNAIHKKDRVAEVEKRIAADKAELEKLRG